jgi:hypothetical protein
MAATEAQYAEMWAQDAAEMYRYAGSSAAASALTPFTPPAPTTNPAGLAGQAAAIAQAAGTSGRTGAQTMMSTGPQPMTSVLQARRSCPCNRAKGFGRRFPPPAKSEEGAYVRCRRRYRLPSGCARRSARCSPPVLTECIGSFSLSL